MKKNGFTLTEALMALAIMGILIGAGISTFNNYDKGIKHLYSNTYYVLDRALYNATSVWIPKDSYAREPFQATVTNESNGSTASVSDTQATKRLCRALIEYINPVDSDNRDAICTSTKHLDDIGNSFPDAKVQFTATNGVRFWISKRYPTNPAADDTRFFIIYADLNGPKRPNSMEYVKGSESNKWKTKDPDIFAFAALDTGRICPIGISEVEQRYMTARIQYEDEGADNEVVLRYSEPSKPLVAAKAEAWGYYLPASSVPSGEIAVNDNDIIEGQPLSYSGYLRSKINNSSKIYSYFLPSGQTMSSYVQADSLYKDSAGNFTLKYQSDAPKHQNNDLSKPNIGGLGCVWDTADPCIVIVDKYVD